MDLLDYEEEDHHENGTVSEGHLEHFTDLCLFLVYFLALDH
jgi:hypothetical protein